MITERIGKVTQGIAGELEIFHFQSEGRFIYIYNQNEDSVCFITGSSGAKAWIEALSLPQNGMTAQITNEGARADIRRVGDEFHLEVYDPDFPGPRIKAAFNPKQVEAIIEMLRADDGISKSLSDHTTGGCAVMW